VVGKILGHYEILEPLGKGGMGEVYRARDTTLKRDVAIKVLPEDLAADPDRLARLEREAHLLAALNHTNIATIHSLEEVDETRFLVLELVKGESLQQRLAGGPLRTEVALDLCKQIAEALEAAHSEGIIHRDLKPANVLITPSGQAKVLDFGLAKAFEANASGGDITQSPTLTIAGTEAGMILGTAPYMSPEQIRGLPLDKRVDIWAFGCVVYETLTAARAFARETVADTLAAILESEPNWGALPGATPPAIGGLVKRCLRKDPARRLHDIADARIEIEEALSGDTDAMSAVLAAPAAAEATRGVSWWLAASLAVASAFLAASGVWVTIPAPESVPWQFHIDYPTGTSFRSTSTLGLAFSPDGKSVVFDANRQLWRQASDGTAATAINGTEGARTPFFSTNGEWLGFWGSDGQMKKVPINGGGGPQLLGAAPQKALGASWADDGYIYFGQGGGISRIHENGGRTEVIVASREGERAYGPHLLPGGEWLLFTLWRSGAWDDASIVAQRLSGGEHEQLVDRGTDGRYVRQTGHLIYSVDGDLYAVAFDADSMEVTGDAVPIIDGVRQSSGEGYFAGAGQTGATQYAFSDLGGLAYMPTVGVPGMWQIIWAGRDGVNEPLPFEPGRFGNVDLSPDDQRLALQVTEEDGEPNIWIYELERSGVELEQGGSRERLTTEGNGRFPRWSHDGQWVFFASDRLGGDNNFDIWKKPANRLGEALLVWDGEVSVNVWSISSDDQMLLISGGGDIWLLRLGSDQEPERLFATEANDVRASFSPNDRLFAYVSTRSGGYQAHVMELATRNSWPVSTPDRGGGFPVWSPLGTEIFFTSPIGPGILGVGVETDPFSPTAPRELSSVASSTFDVTQDGQRFIALVPAGSVGVGGVTAGDRINVDLNWFEKLNRRVPTGGR